MNYKHIFLVFLCLLLSITQLQANRNWIHELPKSRFVKMNVFERSMYNKAMKLIKSKQYRAAAGQFEKFKIQHRNSNFISYVLFMQGYCLYLNKDRNKAIKIFNEVLDFFGEEIDDASAALYFLGRAHFENGDTRDGMLAMKEMAEDVDYQKHALAAGAIRALAENLLKNKNETEAIKYLKQIRRDFIGKNDYQVNGATQRVLNIYLSKGEIGSVEKWLLTADNKEDTSYRTWLSTAMIETVTNGYRRNWNHIYTKFKSKERMQNLEAFWAYFQKQKVWYEKENKLWDYFYRSIILTAHCFNDSKIFNELTAEFMSYISKLKDFDDKLSWAVREFGNAKKFELAKMLIDKIQDKNKSLYRKYELYGQRMNEWGKSVTYLKELRQSKDAKWAKTALRDLAWVYKDRLRKYDEAIKLYLELDEPPASLWGLYGAYYHKGDSKNALRMLSEIESMFDKEKSKAAWARAQYYHTQKNAKKTISECKRILRVYKKTKEYSLAHQLLEDYGIDTAGGVINE